MSDKKITDLETFSGTPGSTDYLAIENSTNTYKVPASEIKGRTYTGAYGIAVIENQIILDVRGLSTNSQQSADPTNVFPFQTAGGSVHKIQLSTLAGILLGHIRYGTGITAQGGSDLSGPYITLSASGYTAGDGIDISNREIAVKLGEGLEINENTGNIDVVVNNSGVTFHRVRYYNSAGTTLLHREYVESGDDAAYSDNTYTAWATSAGGDAVYNITKNITQNLDLYGAPATRIDVDFTTPLYEQYGGGTTGIDGTYTAAQAQTVLVINTEIVGEAVNSHTSGATTKTTGTVIHTDSHTSDYNLSRDCDFILSIISLAAGDTITLSNNHSNSHASQMHLIFEVDSLGDIDNTFFETVIDTQKDNTYEFTPSVGGKYILLALQATTNAQISAAITGVTADSAYSAQSSGYVKAAIGQYTMTTNDTAELTTATISSYVSKLYAIWAL